MRTSYRATRDAREAAFAAALAAKPDYPPALLGEARIKAGARDLAGALALVDKALAKAPNSPRRGSSRGAPECAGQLDDGAWPPTARRSRSTPDYVPAHVALVTHAARATASSTKPRKALDAMKKVAPEHPQTLLPARPGSAYAQKNYPAAREAIQQQLRSVPDNLPGLLLAGAIDLQLQVLRPGRDEAR